MSEYRRTYPGGLYFVTLTVMGWLDVLSANFCLCNHEQSFTLIAARGEEDLGALLGRFKSVTAKKMLKLIAEHPQESRREWMLYMFRYFAKNNKQYDEYHFWHYTNRPVELFSNAVIGQKVDYIHNNPVEAGIVTEPQYYKWSSANPDSPIKVLPL
ncbi:MAG TPA: hypothetical protein VNJ07_09365 [Chitinophagales bacterium]|nr:hypothetical protein [Chitinophagales bacterium]